MGKNSAPDKPRGGGGGGGGTLIFSDIRRLASFFLVQNFEFQYFWGFSEKRIFFWVCRFCGYFFGVITKLDYIYFRGHFYAL